MIRKTIRVYEVGKDKNPDESCEVGIICKGYCYSVWYNKKLDMFNVCNDGDTKTEIKPEYWFRFPKV